MEIAIPSEIVYKRLPTGSEIYVEYDANRQPIRVVENGAVTTLAYGGMGWLHEKIEPGGRTTQYRYDVQGNVVLVRNGRGDEFHIVRDAAGQPTAVKRWEGQWVKVERNGPETRAIDGPEGLVTLERDELGRIVSVDTGQETIELQHGWGGLSVLDNGSVRLEMERDKVGRIAVDKQGAYKNELAWHGGKLAKLASNVALPITYEYGPHGHLSTITTGRQKTFVDHPVDGDAISYLGPGLLVRKHTNAAGRMLSQTVSRFDPNVPILAAATQADPGVVYWLTYDYDDRDRLRSIRRWDGTHIEFELTDAGQVGVRRATRGDQVNEERIAYDGAGTPRMAGATYDAFMRPVSLRDERFAYDSCGRLSERVTDEGAWRYHYNGLGHLVKVEAPRHVVTMDYDARGRRMRKQVRRFGELVKDVSYVWSGHTLLHEVDEVSKSTRTYVRAPNSWAYLGHVDVEAGRERALHYILDPSGGLDFAVDDTGSIVWAANRTTYGYGLPSVQEVDVTLRLPNQFWDADVQLTYNRHRWFDARVGQYICQDPYNLGGTMLNPRDYPPNPNDYCDPTGLMPHPGVGTGEDTDDFHPSPEGATTPIPPQGTDDQGRPTGLSAEYLSGPGHWVQEGTEDEPGYAECPEGALDKGSGFGSCDCSAQFTVDQAGDLYGCHSCGARSSGYSSKGLAGGDHWTCDHQPPRTTYSSSTASKAGDDEARDTRSTSTVRLYPHCKNGSSRQGGVMRGMTPLDRVSRGLAVMSSYSS